MRAGDTHQRWHPHEDEAYLRAAIARVNGGDMDELRDKIADILTDATDERHNRTVRGDYDPIDEDPYVTRILAAVGDAPEPTSNLSGEIWSIVLWAMRYPISGDTTEDRMAREEARASVAADKIMAAVANARKDGER